MERLLIPLLDQMALRSAIGAEVLTESARVRAATHAPASWRLCPSLTAFYDPAGMTDAEIAAYDATRTEVKALKQRDIDMPVVRAFLDFMPTLVAAIDAGTYDAGEAENRLFQTIRKYRRGLKQE